MRLLRLTGFAEHDLAQRVDLFQASQSLANAAVNIDYSTAQTRSWNLEAAPLYLKQARHNARHAQNHEYRRH